MMRSALLVLLLGLAIPGLPQGHVLVLGGDAEVPRWAEGPFKADGAAAALAKGEAVRNALVREGYLEASLDGCATRGDTTTCTLHRGPAFRWARLRLGNVPRELASEVHFRERLFEGRPVQPDQLARVFEDLLDACDRTGHPFASVGLDSLRPTEEGLEAALRLDRGRFVRIDSVVVKGTAHIADRYLRAHIGIRPGDPYDERLVAQVDRRIKELPFIAAKQPAHVLFSPDQTKLYLFLDGKRASSINGVLGVQPDAATGKVRFTGDLDLRLRNALRRGEAIDLNWRSLADRTQDLKVRLNLPYLFNTPFGADASLKLFKRDTSFIEVNARIALEYLMDRGDKVYAFAGSKTSDRLGRTTTTLPGLADVDIRSYGLGVQRERFDYRFNPRQGHSVLFEGSAGTKRTTTSVIGEDPVEVNTVQYELVGTAVGHIPVGRRGTFRFAGQGGWMVNDDLYTNELYRIGGLRTMRGLDEASIYCSAYAIGTLEYRLLFEENSNVLLFVDQGWWQDASRDEPLEDAPLGFGVGTSFETRAGIFSLTYALARQGGLPVDLREGKVHFGFASLF
jgi:outer membrane protein assembly factor BamA